MDIRAVPELNVEDLVKVAVPEDIDVTVPLDTPVDGNIVLDADDDELVNGPVPDDTEVTMLLDTPVAKELDVERIVDELLKGPVPELSVKVPLDRPVESENEDVELAKGAELMVERLTVPPDETDDDDGGAVPPTDVEFPNGADVFTPLP